MRERPGLLSRRGMVAGSSVLLGGLGGGSAALAQAVAPLYRAMTVVTGYDMRSRPAGFARTLMEVLVKVSGETRLARDPPRADAGPHADRLVTAFGYVDQMAGRKVKDDQGTYDRSYELTVTFDPAKVDAALANLDEHPWLGERPVVVPVVAMRGPAGPAYLLESDDLALAAQRRSVALAAVRYGMPVQLPTHAEVAAWHVVADPFQAELSASDGRMTVTSPLAFSQVAPFGWGGSFHMRWNGRSIAGPSPAAAYDLAFDAIVSGALRVASGHGGPD